MLEEILLGHIGEDLFLNDMPNDLQATPNGLLIHYGKTTGDLFGRAFFRFQSEDDKWTMKSHVVNFPRSLKELVHQEICANKESILYHDAALQYVKLHVDKNTQGQPVLMLAESGLTPAGSSYSVPWLVVPAWNAIVKPMPRKAGTGILQPITMHGRTVYSRAYTDSGPQAQNIVVYELGDSYPARSWAYTADGPLINNKPTETAVWLTTILQDKHTLKVLPYTSKEMLEHRLAILVDCFEEALDYFGESLENYSEIVNDAIPFYFPPEKPKAKKVLLT